MAKVDPSTTMAEVSGAQPSHNVEETPKKGRGRTKSKASKHTPKASTSRAAATPKSGVTMPTTTPIISVAEDTDSVVSPTTPATGRTTRSRTKATANATIPGINEAPNSPPTVDTKEHIEEPTTTTTANTDTETQANASTSASTRDVSANPTNVPIVKKPKRSHGPAKPKTTPTTATSTAQEGQFQARRRDHRWVRRHLEERLEAERIISERLVQPVAPPSRKGPPPPPRLLPVETTHPAWAQIQQTTINQEVNFLRSSITASLSSRSSASEPCEPGNAASAAAAHPSTSSAAFTPSPMPTFSTTFGGSGEPLDSENEFPVWGYPEGGYAMYDGSLLPTDTLSGPPRWPAANPADGLDLELACKIAKSCKTRVQWEKEYERQNGWIHPAGRTWEAFKIAAPVNVLPLDEEGEEIVSSGEEDVAANTTTTNDNNNDDGSDEPMLQGKGHDGMEGAVNEMTQGMRRVSVVDTSCEKVQLGDVDEMFKTAFGLGGAASAAAAGLMDPPVGIETELAREKRKASTAVEKGDGKHEKLGSFGGF